MPIVFLVRHGENDFMKNKVLAGRIPGIHLNETGKKQAEQVAEQLKKFPITGIYSSPLERAYETAAPLANALNLEVIKRDELLEVDYGEWQGKSYEWLYQQDNWKKVHATPSLVRFPGGENFVEAQSRMCGGLTDILNTLEKEEMAACFTHADCIRLLVTFYLGMPIDNYQRLYIGPASIAILEIKESVPCLISINHEFTLSNDKS